MNAKCCGAEPAYYRLVARVHFCACLTVASTRFPAAIGEHHNNLLAAATIAYNSGIAKIARALNKAAAASKWRSVALTKLTA